MQSTGTGPNHYQLTPRRGCSRPELKQKLSIKYETLDKQLRFPIEMVMAWYQYQKNWIFWTSQIGHLNITLEWFRDCSDTINVFKCKDLLQFRR
eukprot:gene26054-biopygen13341